MKKTLSLFMALIATSAIWASNVITYTADAKLPEYTDFEYSGLHTNAFNVPITSHTFSKGTGTITFAGDVTSIGDYAFAGSELTSITIPNSVTSIGNDAFEVCLELTSINIPNSVTSIGEYAFGTCYSLTSVIIGNSVTNIGEAAFYYCTSLTSVTIGNSVTSIGDYAFGYCSSLTSVIIGNSVTNIGEAAFYYCTSLTSVTIGNSVTSIGNYAFYGCSGLTSITIPKSLTSLGISSFGKCSNLTSIVWNAKNCQSPINPFNDATNVSSFVFGDEVESIPAGLCQGMSKLATIVVMSENTKYDSRVKCNAIIETASNTLIIGCKNTIIPNSVTSIGDGAFYDCSGLTSITIPNSVTSIGEEAFYGCSGLTSITIPNSVTSIGKFAFGACSSLTSVIIGDSVTSIGYYAFSGCSSIRSVTIGRSVTSIGAYAFDNCSSVTSIVWNAKNCQTELMYDGGPYYLPFYYAFNVSSLIIGDEVESIPAGLCYGMSGLTSITCEAAVPPICGNDYCFDGVSTSIPVYVPCASVAAYQTANGWSDFTNIQPIEGSCGGNIETSLIQIDNHAKNAEKLLRDGQLLIQREGRVYDLRGQVVK